MIHDHLDLYFEAESVSRETSRVLRLHATEKISQLYRVEIELAIRDAHAVTADLLGLDGTVVIDDAKGKVRRFTGIVTEVEEMPETRDWKCFRLVLRPRAWIATLVTTYDIHLDVSVPQIVEAKLREIVTAPPLMRLSESYAPREIVAQYAETDHAFVSRLCEHLGIFWFHEHHEGGEVVVFGDHGNAYTRLDPEDDAVPFGERGSEACVFEIAERRALVPALFVCRDYNYRNPQLDVTGQHQLEQGFAGGHIEYGAHTRDEAQAKRLAAVRAEEQRARHDVFVGKSSDIRFAAGHAFTLTGHPRHALRLALVEVVHEARQPLFDEIVMAERGYEARFVAIPADVAYRPPRETPVPKMHGLVTGIVETSQGELESYAKIDDQGRYVVSFLFDAGGADRQRASAPVRMVQASAGPGYGNHFPLKPGVEVVVAFVDGNVDRPIIVGAVPNPITPTPVNAAEATKSRIQTRSGILIEFEDSNRRA